VGRLAKQKNYPSLIKAFKILKTHDVAKDIKLVILGEGPEKQNIIDLINSLKLKDEIFLFGHKKNPFPLIKNASAYVLSSINEGFGLVIIEALALKNKLFQQIVQMSREILKDGKFGKLVPVNNAAKLSEGLLAILNGDIFLKRTLFLKDHKISVWKIVSESFQSY